ncbi:MAG TPA: hypothetical protein VIY49_03390 [Bryobacteraceae bacterium]
MPIPDPLPLGTTLPAMPTLQIDFFNCTVSVSGATFQVYGSIFASNSIAPEPAPSPPGFNSSLAFIATVVVLTPVLANPTTVEINVQQGYDIPVPAASFDTISSNLQVNGTCNDSTTELVGLSFSIDGPGPDIPGANCNIPVVVGGFMTPTTTETVGESAPSGPPPTQIQLGQTGGAFFPGGSAVAGALTLQMQQIAYINGFGGDEPVLPPPPFPPAICKVLGPCPDFMNEFIPPPDPSNGFVIVYAGDVGGFFDIGLMAHDPTVNAFFYQFGDQATASSSLDANGNTVVTFGVIAGGPSLTGAETYCYNGPTSCNNNPHFGVDAIVESCPGTTCPTLEVLAQYWTNTPDMPLPSLSVSGPGLTGPKVDFVTVFAEVTAAGNTVGQWFEKPYTTNAAPLLCLSNNTAAAETLSNAGFLVTPIAVLQSMNYGSQPPPGPGSPFTNLPGLNALFLPSGGTYCFTAPVQPDIAVTTGNPSGQGVLTIPVSLNNTGGIDASGVTISSIKPISPATYIGPALPVTVGNITAGTTVSQNIQINVAGLASGSIARFQINGSFQDSAGNSFQYSSVRGVQVP